jgi:hypothetical protein
MLHASDILLHSRPFDKTNTINKFNDIVYDILGQFKLEHLDRLIYLTNKRVSDIEIRNSLIDGIITGRCSKLKKLFSDISINEQFFVLAHLNLDSLTPKVENPNPIFVSMVHSFVRDLII